MSRLHFRSQNRRRGATLIVVVAFLALGLTLGIAFLFKAMHQARFMQMVRESAQGGRSAGVNTGTLGNNDEAPPEPSDLFNTALGDLIYDKPDDETGFYNGLRGHSFARAMYGWNAANPTGNTTAYSGFGRTHFGEPNIGGADDYNLINYTRFQGDGFIRYPERVTTLSGMQPPGPYIAKCAPYTYPDENNLFLAAVRSDGYVLVPSFHRPWLVGNPSNAMWTNPAGPGKYYMLRPRAVDNPGFPQIQVNADGVTYGDVENLEGKPVRQLDSVWIDLDSPVRKWKGRLYKPLYAFLIVDLDGRVNTNVAMDLKGPGFTHTSNQGWGPWEMNLNLVFPPFTAGNNQGNALVGAGNNNLRRYLTNVGPTKVFALDNNTAGQMIPALFQAPYYSKMDYDGSVTTTGAAPPMMSLPTGYYTAPSNAIAWAPRYQNGTNGEQINHPLLYNPYFVPPRRATVPPPRTGDRAFGPEEMFYLNHRLNSDRTSYLLSDMGQLNQPYLVNASYGAVAPDPRWLLTSISNDLQVAGLRPSRTSGSAPYLKVNPATLATGGPIGSPIPGNMGPALDSDFNTTPASDWRSVVAGMLGSIDLNRKLTDYRQNVNQSFELNAQNGTLSGPGSQAERDRQQLAKDIFDRLAAATGARTSALETLPVAGTPQFNALRQLAQMAVNIVDYIDNDDYMTPFDWNLGLPGAGAVERLWGTELPRLVINEAYAMEQNDPTDPGLKNPITMLWTPTPGKNYQYNIWAELYNPLTPPGGGDPNLSHGGAAPLVFNNNAVYQLKILRNNNFDPQLRQETNLTGDLPSVNIVSPLGNNNSVVAPSNATAGTGVSGGNPGFYLVGPGRVPGNDNVLVNYTAAGMSIPIVPAANLPVERPPTLLLQRLACPHQAFNAVTNPFITVDYMSMPNGSVYDHRQFILPAQLQNPQQVSYQNFDQHRSFGHSQPYAAHPSRLQPQQKIPAPVAGDTAINHTFYRQNNSTVPNWRLDSPFDWLVHLDRQLISPAELFCVSAWKPHELTQQFITLPGAGAPRHQHLADWGQSGIPVNSNLARLYRALGLLDVRNRTLGMPFGGRVPGKININTIWDRQVLQAMCDPTPANYFGVPNINNIYTAFNSLGGRSPMIGNGGASVWTTGPSTLIDQPFLPAPSNVPPGDPQLGNENANRSIVANPMFKTGQAHPYLNNELVNKIFNNVTTRSNTFAIWCTVGYFEVENPGPYSAANRPRLGAELDLDTGANIRHKFFAIVDRTNLAIDPTSSPNRPLQGARPVFLSYEPLTADVRNADVDTTVPANRINGSIVVRVPALANPSGGLAGLYDGAPWVIRVGDQILLDTGLNQEIAMVSAVNFAGPGIGGNVTLTLPPGAIRHSRGCAMQLPIPNSSGGPSTTFARLGNPGPQPMFNYRDQRYSGVVRFFTQVR